MRIYTPLADKTYPDQTRRRSSAGSKAGHVGPPFNQRWTRVSRWLDTKSDLCRARAGTCPLAIPPYFRDNIDSQSLILACTPYNAYNSEATGD